MLLNRSNGYESGLKSSLKRHVFYPCIVIQHIFRPETISANHSFLNNLVTNIAPPPAQTL